MHLLKVSSSTTVSGFNSRTYSPVEILIAWLLAFAKPTLSLFAMTFTSGNLEASNYKHLAFNALHGPAHRVEALLQEMLDVVIDYNYRKFHLHPLKLQIYAKYYCDDL